jgi:nitroreductase
LDETAVKSLNSSSGGESAKPGWADFRAIDGLPSAAQTGKMSAVTTIESFQEAELSAFHKLVKNRRSVRSFRPDIVEEEKIGLILDAMMAAPSAGNLQSYKVVIVRDDARKKALVEAAENQAFIAEASDVLVFFAHPEHAATRYHQRGAQLFSVQDASVACAYAQLAATALNLGTVWIGSFDEDAVSRILQANSEWRPVAILPIGYPDSHPEHSGRKPLDQVLHKKNP